MPEGSKKGGGGVAAGTTINLATSQWKEFWAEFMLGAKVFAGFEAPVVHTQKQSASV